MLKRINDALPGLVFGIVFYGIVVAAVFSAIGAVFLMIASVDLFLELHMEYCDMFKLFSYSKMIP